VVEPGGFMAKEILVTGNEQFFDENEIIVSKTDLKGRLTYCNDIFLRVAGYSEKECLGQPHSMIRHPDMPRCVFDLLWQFIQDGREIFAYVKNLCKNGDHYWVLAHVTPSRDSSGEIVGYHSNRRVPDRNILESTIIPLYGELLAEERRHGDRKGGLQAAREKVSSILTQRGVQYDEFILGL
jgi:PAS domain S-box-containing protein